ncbi:hypothetical protein [Lentilactobacillus buchneri]|uniref:hypothetical protein n=1 Tax=Lentilactobacillus buchneri TaxID=1581 RepID=UPI00295438FC|nr:hypothetical protein [Lentilactobacillus buchneri]
MAKKKGFKMPKWLVNTLQVTLMVAILMALYNFLGPMVFKKAVIFHGGHFRTQWSALCF